MRHFICACLLLGLAGTAAADSAYTPVLGAYLINDQLTMSQHGVIPSDTGTTGLGLGLLLDGGGNERLSAEYTDFDMGNKRQLQLIDIDVDHFFRLDSLPEPLRPFAGVAAGYGRLDFPAEDGLSGERSEHLSYGLRLGATWRINPKFDLEMGGRYLHAGLATHPAGAATGAEFAVNADSSLWLGLEYRLR